MIGGKFLGPTKGNRDLPCSYSGPQGGSGESHSSVGSKDNFLGDTKGNRDLKTNRSSGVPGGQGGGPHKAGG
jgi:hypothetical protein